MWRLFLLALLVTAEDPSDVDGETSRKILGSSVVTSVSVIMGTGNGSKVYSDAVGKPVAKPIAATDLASPINLLNPDRYEFYTFDDSGDLVKRLMTLEEIQEIIATGDGDGLTLDTFTSNGFIPEKRFNEVVTNVQNVLKEEMEVHQDLKNKPQYDTPDVSDSWSMILPSIFGNSGEDIKLEKPVAHGTPDTIMIEPTVPPSTSPQPTVSSTTEQISSSHKIMTLVTKKTTPTSTTSTTESPPKIIVDITTNSNSTTERGDVSGVEDTPIVEIKPVLNQLELTKDNSRPIFHVATRKPFPSNPVKVTIGSTVESSEATTIQFSSTPRSTLGSRVPVGTESTTIPTQLITSSSSLGVPEGTETPSTPQFVTTHSLVLGSEVPERTEAPSTPQFVTTHSLVLGSEVPERTETPSIPQFVTTHSLVLGSEVPERTETPSTPQFVTTHSLVLGSEVPERAETTTPSIPQFITTHSLVLGSGVPVRRETTVPSTTQVITTPSSSVGSRGPGTETKVPSTTQFVVTPSSTLGSRGPETDTKVPSTTQFVATPSSTLGSRVPVRTETSAPSTIQFVTTPSSTSGSRETTTSPTSAASTVKFVTTAKPDAEPTTVVALTVQPETMPTTISATEVPSQVSTTAEASTQFVSQNFEETTIQSELSTVTETSPQETPTQKYRPIRSTTTSTRTTSPSPLETSTQSFSTTTERINSSTLSDIEISTIPMSFSLVTGPEVISTEVPVVKKPVLPTLLDILNKNTLSTTPSDQTTTNLPSTLGGLSTFFIVADNKKRPSTVTDLINNSSAIEDSTTEDLSTLSTEYVALKRITPTITTTEQSQSTDRTTILDQFLLTSTNIYEINSELSNKEYQTTTFEDSNESTTRTETPPTTTTDRNFIDSIEKLISQAVGTVEPPVEVSNMADQVHEMMMDSSYQMMPQVQQETATVASSLIDNFDDTTTVGTTAIDLSDSIGALLSQVSGETSTVDVSTQRSTTSDDFVPHIINITIIRNENRTKPFKPDLRLETNGDEFLLGVKKNLTQLSTGEVLKLEATGAIHESFEETTEFVTKSSTDMNMTEIMESTTASSTTTTASSTTTKSDPEPSIVISIKENLNQTDESSTWTLVSTVDPHEVKIETTTENVVHPINAMIEPSISVDLVHKPLQGFGLEESTAQLDTDVYQFVQLCNELAFSFWKSVTTGISAARSVIVSPFAATSLLAMVFLGARGSTSGEMNEILKLDDMVTFNPHMIFKNVSESIETGPKTGVAISVMIRQLYSDRSKGKLLGFYKERVRQFYDGHVEEASYREIGDVVRRRTNLLVKKYTGGKISEFLKDSNFRAKAPLAGISISIFQTDCSEASTENRDGELYFVALPTIRQRRLVPVPAAVWRSGFLAGYERSLDATAAALGSTNQVISTIFVIPGQQGVAAPGDGLARLEKHLVESSFKQGAWSRLLRSLIPRPGLELQIPRFVHRSIINATGSLKNMGLKDLFDPQKADLRGLNGAPHELHLSDILQINEFATCGENRIGENHHKEVYPATSDRKSRLLEYWDEPRDYQRAFHDPLHDPSYLNLPLPLRPRQARLPEAPRLRFDRPFLYFVRHNPSGLILHMGRFHPRLLP